MPEWCESSCRPLVYCCWTNTGPESTPRILLADLEGVQKYYMQPIMEYSIFHEVLAPGGYRPLAGGAQ